MEIKEFINTGFKTYLPVYYNKTSVLNYNKEQNQIIMCKMVSLEKYKQNKYYAHSNWKPITKIID